MSKQAQKPFSKEKSNPTASLSTTKPDFGFVFVSLYLLVHFIPNLDSVDVIGPQWLALSLLNLTVTGYILLRKGHYQQGITTVLKSGISWVYIALLIWAALSYFYALNKAEVLVNYARIFNTYVAFVNVSVLIWTRKINFKYAAYLITALLFYESAITLKSFFSGLYNIKFDELILSLKGNTGNKNIMAAAIAIKIPFAIYVVYTIKKTNKFIVAFILFLAFFSISILNARTTYVSTLSLILFYTVFIMLGFIKKKYSIREFSFNLSTVLFPLLLAIIFSQAVVKNALEATEDSSGYGTVTDRIETIGFSEQSSGRTGFWLPTLDYIKDHPIIGGGLGNWKLYSIPFVKETTNELIVPYHVHNDFLEMSADLGIPGGIFFALLFLMAIIYFVRSYRNVDNANRVESIFASFALAVYFFDAFLNFPLERPATQILFSIILASISVFYLQAKPIFKSSKEPLFSKIYLFVVLFMLLPSTYFSYLVYKSMQGQMILMRETNSEAKEPLENIANIFPPIPDISVTTLPLQSMKARYYMRDKRYDEAIKLLDEGSKANPYIYYSEFLKAALYFSIDKTDSAYKYGKLSFYNWPRASNYYRNYVAILGKMKDTAEIKNAFATYVKYRNESFAWNTYLMGMLQSKGRGNPELLMMADSALKLFPEDSTLLQRRKEILGTFSSSGTAVTQDLVNQANIYYQEGAQLFAKQSYVAAAQKFIKAASLTPGNYAFFENAGLCYYANRQFDKAVQQFDKAIALGTSTSGKSEYFKGVSLVNLGKKEEGCALVNTAKSRNYPDADTFLKSNCK